MESLRGEIGASMMVSRIMETMLLFVIDTFSSNFEKIKIYMNHETDTGKGQWIRTVNEYRVRLGISWIDFRGMEKKELKKRIREYDTQLWLEEMMHKPSLKWYRMGKKNIGYDMCYRNTVNSTYLAKARTNSLQLEDHIGRGILNYDKTCKLCEIEEDLEQFLVRCTVLDIKRVPEIMRMATRVGHIT